MNQNPLTCYEWDEIRKHDKDDDCWVVLYGKVLNVTPFLNEHPGGLDSIKDMGGMDITSSFESVGHTSSALLQSHEYVIGRVNPASIAAEQTKKTRARNVKWSETDPNELRKYKGGGDIIPLWMIAIIIVILSGSVYLFI